MASVSDVYLLVCAGNLARKIKKKKTPAGLTYDDIKLQEYLWVVFFDIFTEYS